VSDPIRHLANAEVVIRRADGTRNEFGEWEGTLAAAEPVRVYLEPISDADRGRERLLTYEGARVDDALRVWFSPTVQPLKLSPADRVEVAGAAYMAVKADAYRGPLKHQVATLVLLHDNEAGGDVAAFTPLRRDVERWLRAAIARGCALPAEDVIPAPDDGPRPAGPYAALRLVSLQYDPEPEERYELTRESPTGTRTTDQLVGAVYDATWYRGGAVDRAARARAYLTGPGDNPLKRRGVVIRDISDAEYKPAVVGARHEDQAGLLVHVQYAQSLVTPVEGVTELDLRIVADADGSAKRRDLVVDAGVE
jgi:hypothetical protein